MNRTLALLQKGDTDRRPLVAASGHPRINPWRLHQGRLSRIVERQRNGDGMASETEDEVLKGIIEQALKEAHNARAERVTIRVGALQRLWDKFEERGLALTPFAELAGNLGAGDPDDKSVAAKVTCGDLRAAKRAVS